MKVELSIKSDSELRAAIKDMIKGQITNIIREELKDMVMNEMTVGMTKQPIRMNN